MNNKPMWDADKVWFAGLGQSLVLHSSSIKDVWYTWLVHILNNLFVITTHHSASSSASTTTPTLPTQKWNQTSITILNWLFMQTTDVYIKHQLIHHGTSSTWNQPLAFMALANLTKCPVALGPGWALPPAGHLQQRGAWSHRRGRGTRISECSSGWGVVSVAVGQH